MTVSFPGPHSLCCLLSLGPATSAPTLDSPRSQAQSGSFSEHPGKGSTHLEYNAAPEKAPTSKLREENGGLTQTAVRGWRRQRGLGIQVPRTFLGISPVPPPLPEDLVSRRLLGNCLAVGLGRVSFLWGGRQARALVHL